MARGAQDKKDWTVPGPLRALMWWPGISFLLVLMDPDNIAWTIPASAVLLVAVGFALTAVRRLRPVAAPATAGTAPAMDADPPTMEIDMPTIEFPSAGRAA